MCRENDSNLAPKLVDESVILVMVKSAFNLSLL